MTFYQSGNIAKIFELFALPSFPVPQALNFPRKVSPERLRASKLRVCLLEQSNRGRLYKSPMC